MDDQELFALFRKNGYKVTTQRLAICKFILSRNDHPTAEVIYQELRKEYPTISLGTIYKTLHLLKELGLIQELGFNEGSIRYDPDMELHINMVCSICGKIYDYKAENVKKLWNVIISDIGIKPDGQRIDLYYKCDDCKKNEL
ncbi:MAG: transcriptional repressor [Candidatus Lokiarchaeota archaeon]|nr:transcriptional repressor [Candidatus Lokiarchaeota archaeon]